MLKLLVKEVLEQYARENFKRIQSEWDLSPLLRGQFVLKELTFDNAVTDLDVPHGLSFLPKDVMITYITGAGQLTVNYDKITDTNLNVTATDACVARLLVGRLGT